MVGNLSAKEADIKDDFSSGVFIDSTLVLNDGSYLSSKNQLEKLPTLNVLQKAIYSFCPNNEIKLDNDLAGKKRDFASIKSSKTTINKEEQTAVIKHGILRIYDFRFYIHLI